MSPLANQTRLTTSHWRAGAALDTDPPSVATATAAAAGIGNRCGEEDSYFCPQLQQQQLLQLMTADVINRATGSHVALAATSPVAATDYRARSKTQRTIKNCLNQRICSSLMTLCVCVY